jgi:hypothetical protein
VGATTVNTCSDCSAGKYAAVAASTDCTDCVAGKFSTSLGSSTCSSDDSPFSGLPTDTFLKLVLVLPLTERDFTIEKRLAFRQAVAIAGGVVLDRVRIVEVMTVSTRRRMLLSQSTRVTTEIAAKDKRVADAIVGRLTVDKVNAQLQQAGLPLAASLEISGQVSITPSPQAPDKSNSIALIGGIVGGVVGVALLGGLAYALQRRSALSKASGSSREDGIPALQSNLEFTDLCQQQPVSQPVAQNHDFVEDFRRWSGEYNRQQMVAKLPPVRPQSQIDISVFEV